jgi:hypothetical protein
MVTDSAMSSAVSSSKSSFGTAPLINPTLNFTASSPSASSSPGPFNFAPLLTVRLSSDNYIYWRAQVTQVFRSHLLLAFLDGSFPCPTAEIDNPAFKTDATQ